MVKDSTSIGDNAMTKLLRDWERFEFTVFVCHLRGAARTLQEQDTHPFTRSHGRRDWVLAHNGDLFVDLARALPLGDDPVFEPVGRTDSEHAFCWLLEAIRQRKARRLIELGWEALGQLFAQLDSLGTANFLLTDGVDVAAYSDGEGYNPLHWARFLPPHPRLHFESEDIVVDLDDATDRSRSVALVATLPMSAQGWQPMRPGQLLVLRRGAVIHDSHADAPSRNLIVVPRAPASGPVGGRLPPLSPQPRFESAMQHSGHATLVPPLVAFDPLDSSPTEEVLVDARLTRLDDSSAQVQTQVVAPAPTPAPAFTSQSDFALLPPLVPLPPLAPLAPIEPLAPLPPLALLTEAPVSRSPGFSMTRAGRAMQGRLLWVVHETVYRYDTPVERSSHLYRLRPGHDLQQEIVEPRAGHALP